MGANTGGLLGGGPGGIEGVAGGKPGGVPGLIGEVPGGWLTTVLSGNPIGKIHADLSRTTCI